jgi:hypothetical protein
LSGTAESLFLLIIGEISGNVNELLESIESTASFFLLKKRFVTTLGNAKEYFGDFT